MTAATALQDAQQRLRWHEDHCDACKTAQRCVERALLVQEMDRCDLEYIESLSTGRLR